MASASNAAATTFARVPFVTLAESLIGKGLALKVCDPDIALGKLVGRNRAYIDEKLPHLAQLMTPEWEQLVADADVVIVSKKVEDPVRLAQCLRPDQLVIDLVGIDALGETALRPWLAPVAAVRGAVGTL